MGRIVSGNYGLVHVRLIETYHIESVGVRVRVCNGSRTFASSKHKIHN